MASLLPNLSVFFLLICLCVADEYHPTFSQIPSQREEPLEDKDYWNTIGEDELQEALNVALNENVAKNVILFIGDGMGISTVTAGRIYNGQLQNYSGEETLLSFENFPHVGLAKTYNVDAQVPDSAGTATAYLSGSKASSGVLGYDGRVTSYECEAATADTIVHSIVKLSQDANKRTGVVTSTRITHATPGASYAHSASRNWECDADIDSATLLKCPTVKDIAAQLVDEEPGRNLNVIMGGGYQFLDGSAVNLPGDDLSSSCKREDGRVLWQEWLDQKSNDGLSAAFVRNRTDLMAVDVSTTDYLMGIFSNSHMPYEHEKDGVGDFPSLSEMTDAAIRLLNRSSNGFFLLVEGGRIDHAHHSGKARKSLDELVAMDKAVQTALSLTNEEDTLIIVTADHSHTLSINGYPSRGTSILGVSLAPSQFKAYTSLTYANGPGYNYYVVNDTVNRPTPLDSDTQDFDYRQQAGVPLSSETHGGEDVAMYGIGPMAHLLEGVHEQNFIAHVMAYASDVCRNLTECANA